MRLKQLSNKYLQVFLIIFIIVTLIMIVFLESMNKYKYKNIKHMHIRYPQKAYDQTNMPKHPTKQ